MNAAEAALINALRDRLSLVANETSRLQPAQHLAKLRLVSEKIVALQGQLPRPIDPELAHFLARCSYDKALAFLEGRALSRP